MADQPGQEPKDTGQETIFNSGIGDDWGEAFEAEDFMAASNEAASTEFFLPDEVNEPVLAPPPVEAAEKAKPGTASLLDKFSRLSQSLFVRFRSLSLPLRLLALALPVLALTLFLIFRGRTVTPLAPGQANQPQEVVGQPTEPEPPATHPPDHEAKSEEEGAHPNLPEHQTIVESQQATPQENVLKSKPLEGKELQKKWRFPGIIVHAKTDKDHAPVILSVDLTLSLKLAPEIMPPSAKESFIREVLYQFYTNQPIDDLQRYAIERGEMNRKLQAWIMKQWPELSLNSIIIDRYQIL